MDEDINNIKDLRRKYYSNIYAMNNIELLLFDCDLKYDEDDLEYLKSILFKNSVILKREMMLLHINEKVLQLDCEKEFNEDINKVRAVLLKVANDYTLVLADPKPRVSVTAFGESSIELLFAMWCQQANFMQVKDEIHEMIRNSFVANQIEIP